MVKFAGCHISKGKSFTYRGEATFEDSDGSSNLVRWKATIRNGTRGLGRHAGVVGEAPVASAVVDAAHRQVRTYIETTLA